MKHWRLSSPALACALVALVLAMLTLGPFMRETDQAWLLDGGMGIANGHPEIARAEFNFDKQFISYLLAGLLFKFLPRPFTGDELVLAANIFQMFFFWGAMTWLLARSAQKLPLALALPVILAPTFLVYSSFYASAFTSVAFVMLLAIFLKRKKWSWPLHLISFALAFLAVGARVDAMFLLPLLAMLHSPRRTFVSVLKSPNTWLMASGGLTAFFLGRPLYLAETIDVVAWSFQLKQWGGFVAFGLGGSALVLVLALVAIPLAWRANRCKAWLAFLWLGLFLPVGYYSLQLLSPRHCTVGAVSVLVFICAGRGQAIVHNFFQAVPAGWAIKTICAASAIVPLFVGVNLNDLKHPRPTTTNPTWLPTGAGVAPTGAYLSFALSIRQRDGFLDHNQALWSAAQSVKFETNVVGRVPYLSSPVTSYSVFAIRLQGHEPEKHSLGENPPPEWFYTDNRSFLRFQFVFPLLRERMGEIFSTLTFAPAAEPRWQGLTIYRAIIHSPAASIDLSAGLWALNQAFGLDEFRLVDKPPQQIPAEWAGKKIVVASHTQLNILGAPPPQAIADPLFGTWWIYSFDPMAAGQKFPVEISPFDKSFIGVGALPQWMSLQKR
jgi:hypothetical protein